MTTSLLAVIANTTILCVVFVVLLMSSGFLCVPLFKGMNDIKVFRKQNPVLQAGILTAIVTFVFMSLMWMWPGWELTSDLSPLMEWYLLCSIGLIFYASCSIALLILLGVKFLLEAFHECKKSYFKQNETEIGKDGVK